MFIIKDGVVSVMLNETEEVRRLQSGDYIGINSIIIGGKRSMNIKALTRVKAYEVTVKDLKNCFGIDFKELLLFSIFKVALKRNSTLSEMFGEKQLQPLFNCFKRKVYSKGEVIYKKGRKDKKLVVLIEGDLIDSKGKLICPRGFVYGEDLTDNTEQCLSNQNH